RELGERGGEGVLRDRFAEVVEAQRNAERLRVLELGVGVAAYRRIGGRQDDGERGRDAGLPQGDHVLGDRLLDLLGRSDSIDEGGHRKAACSEAGAPEGAGRGDAYYH